MGGIGSGIKGHSPEVARKNVTANIEKRLSELESQAKLFAEQISRNALSIVAEYQRAMELKYRIGRLEALAARDTGDDK